jgi:winged helix DNA-binding protein
VETGEQRLLGQLIARPAANAAAVVAHLGAVQAQDYLAAKWAVGLRTRGVTEADMDAAIAEGAILRTHAFRWTWQFVAPRDIRWMLALVHDRLAKYGKRDRELEIDSTVMRKSRAVVERALRDGDRTRDELGAAIGAKGPRLAHILGRLELGAVICGGRKHTYALLDARVPDPHIFEDREEAIAELGRRYFASRGPATAADFAWWSGLSPADARRATIAAKLARGRVPAEAYLLPPFDEYLIGYRDRAAVLDPMHTKRFYRGYGLLDAVIVIGGLVVGSWRRTLTTDAVSVKVTWFVRPSPSDRSKARIAAERYAAFLGRELLRCR